MVLRVPADENWRVVCVSGSGFNGVPRSGSRRAKMTQKNRKQLINFIFWSAGKYLFLFLFVCVIFALLDPQHRPEFKTYQPHAAKIGTDWKEHCPVPVHNVYAVGLGVRDMLLHEAAEPGEVGRDARDTCNHRLNMELDLPSLFGLHVHSCTHGLRPRTTPPIPRIWAHIWGHHWLAKIDDISLLPPACNHRTKIKGRIGTVYRSFSEIWLHLSLSAS